MKMVLSALILLSGVAHAATKLTCEQTAKSVQNDNAGYTIDSITVHSEKSITIEATKGNKHVTLTPTLSKYSDQKSVRFVESQENLGDSDNGQTGLFVDRTILAGKAGYISTSSNQANDGDSGGMFIWGKDATFYCK